MKLSLIHILQGTQGYNLGGGEDMRRRADSLFGGPMNRKIIPLFEEYQRAPDSTQAVSYTHLVRHRPGAPALPRRLARTKILETSADNPETHCFQS